MNMDKHRYEYLKQYRKANFKHYNILFDKRKERDIKILEAFNKVENKTELVKRLLEKEFGLAD